MAFFSDMPTCSLEVVDAFTAPRRLIAEAGEDQTICEGENVNLTAQAYGGVPPYAYSWEGQTSQSINVTPDETTSYTIQITDSIGCMTEDEVTIHVSPSLDIAFDAPEDFCITEQAVSELGGGTPSGGIYSGPGVQDDGNGMTYTFDPTLAGTGIYTIGYTITSPTLWAQKGSDLDGLVADDEFGQSVSVSADGNRMAVSAPKNDGNGSDAGLIRIYEWNGSNWIQLGQNIFGEAANDRAGRSISLSADGHRVAIGANANSGNGNFAGHTRIYEWDGNNWIQLGQDIDGLAPGDQAGLSVSLSDDGSYVAIGAPGNDENGNSAGQVHVYGWDGNNWMQKGQNLVGAIGSQAGFAVSISADGHRIAVGANFDTNKTGRVDIYEWDGNTWSQLGQQINGAAPEDELGHAVALSSDGNYVIIGAHLNDDNGLNSGHASVYFWNGNMWEQIGQTIEGENSNDLFGSSVAISSNGQRIAIGAPGNDNNGNNAGNVHIYEWDSNIWQQLGQNVEGESAIDLSGTSVSFSANGHHLVIGAPFNDGTANNAGHARVYSLSPSCTYTASDEIEVKGAITNTTPQAQGNCDPFFNTYSQTLEITHLGAPSTGKLSVNGQLFDIETSPQTVILDSLPANGESVNIITFFTDESDCVWEEEAVFTAPLDCTVRCDITNVTAGPARECTESTYLQDIYVHYQGTNLTGSILVEIDGDGKFIPFPIAYSSPQKITLTMPIDGRKHDVFVKFSDEIGCTFNANSLFRSLHRCSCDIVSLQLYEAPICNEDGTYNVCFAAEGIHLPQDLDDPNLKIVISGGQYTPSAIEVNEERTRAIICVENLPSDGRAKDVFIQLTSGCSKYGRRLYTAPTCETTEEASDGKCDITAMEFEETICTGVGTYDLAFSLEYNDPPTAGNIAVEVNGTWSYHSITGSPQRIVVPNLQANGRYARVFAKFTDIDGCTWYDRNLYRAPFTCSANKMGRGENFEIHIFPNPSDGRFTITTSSYISHTYLEVLNSMGQLIKRQEIGSHGKSILDLQGEAEGIYTIKIIQEDSIRYEKVMIRQ